MLGKLNLKPMHLLCVLAILFPLGVNAAGLEEVIVTAQKREQSLQDVSAAVTAVGLDRLQTAQIHSIEDLQMIVPSIHLGNDFNMAKLFIRGVGANTSTTGSETGVALHVDGAVIGRAEAQLNSFFDLERLEVVRGPSGSLYGRNAVGGSINLITAKPTEELSGYARVTGGDYSLIGFEGAVAGPLMSDKVLGRFAVKTMDRDGFGKNPTTGNDVSDLDQKMFRASLTLLPTDDIEVLLSGEFYTQNDASKTLKFRREAFPGVTRLTAIGINAVTGVRGFATAPRDTAAEFDPETDNESWAVTGTVNWQMNDNISFTNIANFRQLDGFIQQDLDISGTINCVTGCAAPTGQNGSVLRRDVESWQWSEELQFKYDSERMNGVIGYYFFDERQRPVDTVGLGPIEGQPQVFTALTSGALIFNGAVPPVAPANRSLNEVLAVCNTFDHIAVTATTVPKRVCIKSDLGTSVHALFGQWNFHFDQFTLKLGGRYSIERRTVTNPSFIFAGNGFGPVIQTTSALSAAKTWKDFTPEVGFEWRASDDLMVYYTYSEGFKAGAGENAAGSTKIIDPEEIQNQEIGLKGTFFDNRLAINVATFTYSLTGQQINKTIAGGPAGFTTVFENAGETSAHGFELEFFGEVSDEFRLNGGVSFVKSIYDDFLTQDPLDPRNISGGAPLGSTFAGVTVVADPLTDFDPTLPDSQLAGNPTRNSPKWSANVHGELDLPGISTPFGGMLTLMGDVSYKSDVFFTEFNRLIEGEDAYTLVDVSLHYVTADGRWTADLWAKNVTDELVSTSTFQLSTGRVIGVTYLPPRMFGGTIGYNF